MAEKKKKPFYKKWWVIAIVVIGIVGALGSNSDEKPKESPVDNNTVIEESNNTDKTKANDAEKPKETKINKHKAGTYKIGTDLPAGEYKIFVDGFMGYYEVAKDSSGAFDGIISNDNFSTFTYVTVEDGQYLKLQMCYAIPAAEASAYSSDKGYGSGKYKVGFDIPAGEYNVHKEEGQLFGYVEVSKDSKGSFDSIITNDNFETNKYITVKDGQYLKIMFGYIQ